MTTPGIKAAAAATAEIEQLLNTPLLALQANLTVSERTGVFSDVDAVLALMVDVKRAIDNAQAIARRTDWPLSPSARRRVLQSLHAGIAQRERRPFPVGDQRGSNPHPAPPFDEAP